MPVSCPIRARLATTLFVSALCAVASAGSAYASDTLTFHGSNDRLGWYAHEPLLAPANVTAPAFGKRWSNPLDGYVNGSPLYMAGLQIAGRKADVVFAATVNNSVYALDATDGSILWATKDLAPSLTAGEYNSSWRSKEKYGITSTPVIDRETGSIYVCTPKVIGLKQVYLVWALDIHTGAIRPGWPVTVAGSYKGVHFRAGEVLQRGALTIQDGWLYIPYGGRGDIPPWRGWIMGIDIHKPDGAQRAFCSSPGSDGAGIWSAGGISVTPDGQVFAVTGNGDYDFPKGDNLAQTVLHLETGRHGLTFSRKPEDYCTPANHLFLDEQDEDLGGATALPLPDQPGTSTPHVLFTGGKDGCAYLMNRDNLGGLGGELQRTRFFGLDSAKYHEGIRATSAYFDAGAAGRFVFVSGDQPGVQDKGMVGVKLAPETPGGPMRFQQVWTLPKDLARPGSPVVTSDGPVGGLVWVVEPEADENAGASTLHAYEALTGTEIYNSERVPADHLSGGRKFVSPTIGDGRVFVGGDGVYCYGTGLAPAAGKGTP